MMRRAALAARAVRVAVRHRQTRQLATDARTDGFNEALPRGDLVVPVICTAMYGFSWWAADEGRIQALAETVEVNTDPNANPTPKQMFHHFWPYAAGTLGMLFESVACKFSKTADMKWLCTTALNDDTNAAIALSILTPPAEFSPAFVRAICDYPGALQRIKDIIHIYKTLPREQHDDVVVNACVVAAKVAAMPDLKAQGLGLGDFVWMLPGDKAHLYAQYGLEGIAALWKDVRRRALCGGPPSVRRGACGAARARPSCVPAPWLARPVAPARHRSPLLDTARHCPPLPAAARCFALVYLARARASARLARLRREV